MADFPSSETLRKRRRQTILLAVLLCLAVGAALSATP